MANFKETQIGSMIEGQIAEIDIDSFPGKVFKGKVQSIIRATGSATTLLPPDNSTGNFTKIVQRVPVKIALSNISAEGTAILRQGMSAVATVAIGKR
jgi:membrane fusion protein (multidrug efflux system)